MTDLIEDQGLEDELEELLIEETCNTGFWLGHDPGPGGLDEASDCEDPMADVHVMRQELAERESFVQAAKDVLDSRVMMMDPGARAHAT
jgi:hypothetical protein